MVEAVAPDYEEEAMRSPDFPKMQMTGLNFAVHGVRHIITRMRLGEFGHETARVGLMGKGAAAKLRKLPRELDRLDKNSPRPDSEIIKAVPRRMSTESTPLRFLPNPSRSGHSVQWTTIYHEQRMAADMPFGDAREVDRRRCGTTCRRGAHMPQ
jgi:hypothetical protein